MRHIAFIFALSSVLLVGCASDQARVSHGGYLLSVEDAKPGSTYEVGVYVIAKGDTIAKICKQFQITIHEFHAINPELQVNGPYIMVGQKVRVFEKIKQEGLIPN
jgi:LysM repeat protein